MFDYNDLRSSLFVENTDKPDYVCPIGHDEKLCDGNCEYCEDLYEYNTNL